MQCNFRIDENTKKKFDILCNKIGLSTTAALTMYMKKAVRENRLPIELDLNEESIQAIEESKKGKFAVEFKSYEDYLKYHENN